MAAKKPLKFRDRRRILKSFGIEEDKSRGKGSDLTPSRLGLSGNPH
jgi:hypothetical protein